VPFKFNLYRYVAAEAEKRYRSGTVSPGGFPGAMEQDPDEWVESLAEAVTEIILEPSSSSSSSSAYAPAAVALSGQMQDVVGLDKLVKPVDP
jgi:sugar (pentulose or hexulose) kinase